MQVLESPPGVHFFSCFDKNIIAGFSGRQFGNNQRGNFLEALGIPNNPLVRVKQVHGNKVVLINANSDFTAKIEADAMITNLRGVTLGILTADCVPVFIRDQNQNAIGIAHAGWKGIKAGVISESLKEMRRHFGCQNPSLRVALGPAIRQCCYQVGEEFREFFPGHFSARFVDLIGVIKEQLTEEHVNPGQVFDSGICTSCQNQRFFSFRRERETKERILSVIQILPEA